MFAARLKCAREISTALKAAAIYRLRRLLCGRANLWLLARGCCPRTELLFVRCAFQVVQSFHVCLRVLAARQIRRDAFRPRQSFTDQNLTQTFPVDFNDDIISALTAASSCRRPTRPDYERLLQKFLRPLFRLLPGFHGLIQRDAKVQALIVRAVALPEISFGRVDVVKARGKLFVGGVDAETVAIVVLAFHIMAIGQLDPLFTIAS